MHEWKIPWLLFEKSMITLQQTESNQFPRLFKKFWNIVFTLIQANINFLFWNVAEAGKCKWRDKKLNKQKKLNSWILILFKAAFRALIGFTFS